MLKSAQPTQPTQPLAKLAITWKYQGDKPYKAFLPNGQEILNQDGGSLVLTPMEVPYSTALLNLSTGKIEYPTGLPGSSPSSLPTLIRTAKLDFDMMVNTLKVNNLFRSVQVAARSRSQSASPSKSSVAIQPRARTPLSQRYPVFSPAQVSVLIEAAASIAYVLRSLNYDYSKGEVVLFWGDSPSWIFYAFQELFENGNYRIVQVPFSGRPFTRLGRKAGEVPDVSSWFEKVLRATFPNGLCGNIWIVDHTTAKEYRRSSVTDLRKTLSFCPKQEVGYGIRYIRIYAPENEGPSWREGATWIHEVLAAEVLVRNPDDHKSRNDFEIELSSNSDCFPRGCPKFSPEDNNWSYGTMKERWTSLFDTSKDQGTKARRAQENITIGVNNVLAGLNQNKRG